jgi:tetratricopeptide (TPR) repeat protein
MVAGSVRADEHQDLITRGNDHFKKGEYEHAIASYEEVIDGGKESAELYYNLGNAYYKTINIPAAILNYERAIKLDPMDEDLRFNLKLANLKTVDKIEVIPTFFIGEIGEDLKDSVSLNTWGWFAIVSLWLSALLFFIFTNISSNTFRRLVFFTALSLLVLSMGSFGLGYQKYNAVYNDLEAIVFAPSVIVKSAPDQQQTDLFLLHEGTKVSVVEEMGEWNKIRLADGSVGWIPQETIEQI